MWVVWEVPACWFRCTPIDGISRSRSAAVDHTPWSDLYCYKKIDVLTNSLYRTKFTILVVILNIFDLCYHVGLDEQD